MKRFHSVHESRVVPSVLSALAVILAGSAWGQAPGTTPRPLLPGSPHSTDTLRGAVPQRAKLGISVTELQGVVRISQIAPNSVAAEAGLRVGDEIVAFNGQPIRTFQELASRVTASAESGKAAVLQIRRQGNIQELTANLQGPSAPNPALSPAVPVEPPSLTPEEVKSKATAIQRHAQELEQQLKSAIARESGDAKVKLEQARDRLVEVQSDVRDSIGVSRELFEQKLRTASERAANLNSRLSEIALGSKGEVSAALQAMQRSSAKLQADIEAFARAKFSGGQKTG